MTDIYEQLRAKADSLSTGFPKTDNGAEYRFLQSIFSEEDAEYAVALSKDYETPKETAARMGKDEDVVAAKLFDMSKRALIYRMRKDNQVYYRFLPAIVGFWDFQANKAALKPEFGGALFDYIVSGYGQTLWTNRSPIFRYLPINTKVVQDNQVLPYDNVLDIVGEKRIAVMNCQCRQIENALGHTCKHANHPQETCFTLEKWADFFVENGDARYITIGEFKVLLKSAEKEGLLVLTTNVKEEVELICMCCSCCCGPLKALNLFPSPARVMVSDYLCKRDDSLCIKDEGCSVCTERCIVGAQKIVDGDVVLDQAACIGCGLCVSTCPTNALVLETKPEEQRPVRPKDVFELHEILASERLGK